MATAVQGEDRTQFLGGSDIAAVLGLDPYKTRLQVYEEKVGLAPSFDGNNHTKRGTRLEEVAAEVYTEITGRKMQRVNRRLVHPGFPFLTARIDRRVLGGPGRLAEIKCPSLGMFSKIKREGLHEGYIAQFQHYLGLVGPETAQANGIYADDGEWVIFCADQWEMLNFEVKPDSKLIADMWERCTAFWNENVLRRVPPTATVEDEERLEIQRAEGALPFREVTVADEEFIGAAMMLREAKAMKKEAELVEAAAKAQVKDLIGEWYGVLVGPGFRLSYSQQNGRKSFDQKALAGQKPLDRIKVGAVLTPYFTDNSIPESVIEAIGKASLDLAQFEKVGQPFTVLRSTFFGDDK